MKWRWWMFWHQGCWCWAQESARRTWGDSRWPHCRLQGKRGLARWEQYRCKELVCPLLSKLAATQEQGKRCEDWVSAQWSDSFWPSLLWAQSTTGRRTDAARQSQGTSTFQCQCMTMTGCPQPITRKWRWRQRSCSNLVDHKNITPRLYLCSSTRWW